jgi:hypothetical protein
MFWTEFKITKIGGDTAYPFAVVAQDLQARGDYRILYDGLDEYGAVQLASRLNDAATNVLMTHPETGEVHRRIGPDVGAEYVDITLK